MVNEDEMMELIDQVRFNLPDEIKQANWTVSEQQRIISEAHAEAARIMSRANERAEETSSEHEILRRAERHSAQVIKDAQAKSDQIIREAEAYALEQLKQLEAHLGRTLATVRRGVEALQSSTAPAEETADQTTGCQTLATWDRTTNADSRGAPLFREFWRAAKDIPKVWRVPFDPAQPVSTPSGLDTATPATRAAIFKALGDAVAIVRAAGFAVDVPMGVPESRVVRGQKIALHGGDEFEGVLNMLESRGQALAAFALPSGRRRRGARGPRRSACLLIRQRPAEHLRVCPGLACDAAALDSKPSRQSEIGRASCRERVCWIV